MKTWQSIFLGFLMGLLASGVILLLARTPSGVPVTLLPPPTPEPIMVHVTGEVNKPGVYSLPINSRVIDAVRAAGDLTPNADTNTINLAEKVNDGEKIIIPSLAQGFSNQTNTFDNQNKTSLDTPININTATEEELQLLPEISTDKAEQIISYRNLHGKFIIIDELLNVPGIGPQTFDKIKQLITTGD